MSIPFLYQPQGPGDSGMSRPPTVTVPHMLPVPKVFRSPQKRRFIVTTALVAAIDPECLWLRKVTES